MFKNVYFCEQPTQQTLLLFHLAVIGGIFIFSLIVVLLILFGRGRRYQNLLLCIGIAGIIWYAVMYLLTSTGYIRHYPYLFNKGLPFYYLIGPCFYLYIRGTIYPQYASFRKIDLLHLLMTIPAICSIMPYCLLDDVGQQYVVDQIAKDQNYSFSGAKYVVGIWHWFTWPLTALIYTVLQYHLIKNAAISAGLTQKSKKWMYGITMICLVTFGMILTLNLAVLFDKTSAAIILNSSKMIVFLALCFLTLGGAFFVNPNFIYGHFVVDGENIAHADLGTVQEKPLSEQGLSKEEATPILPDFELIDHLEAYLSKSKIYLETGLTLSKLAVAADIPSYKLSELLNSHYEQNFNAYVNVWRIKYIVQRLEIGDHKFLTLEALANEAGFTSRNSFFTAFKKQMGVSPSSYISTLKLESA